MVQTDSCGIYIHDGEGEEDKDELASALPGRENLAEQATCTSVGESIDICRIGDCHQCSTEDLDEANRDEQAQECQDKDTGAGRVDR